MHKDIQHLGNAALAVLEFAIQQGRYAESLRSKNAMDTRRKTDGSLVTLADTTISKHAMTELPRIIDVPVVSEEEPPFTVDCTRFWLIDPIDGSSSYSKPQYNGYAVAIALIEHGRPSLGIVVAPALDIAYIAASGQGAYKLCLANQSACRLDHDYGGKPLLATFYHRTDQHQRELEAFLVANGMSLKDAFPESSLLKYCYAAEGRYAFAGGWSPHENWDIAAADIIVHEAGGKMINARSGQAFEYHAHKTVVDSPLAIAKGMQARLPHRGNLHE